MVRVFSGAAKAVVRDVIVMIMQDSRALRMKFMAYPDQENE
jgi:hypothetical protein